MRDIAIRGNDLVVATHGRAFWVLDDVASLRQMSAARAAGGDLCSIRARAYRTRPGSEEGTPLPLDEPHAANPPTGLYIDYYLPAAPQTPAVIDVIARDGSVVRTWSSAQKPKAIDPKTPQVVPSWVTAPPIPSARQGAQRFTWDFSAGSDHGLLVPPGTYTVRLRVNGATYDRTATILRDPRIAASDADLRAQYALAQAIESLHKQVEAARTRALDLAHKPLSAGRKQLLNTQIVGVAPPDNPDDSVGAYSHDFTSFLYLKGALEYLESAVESGDAAPTPDMRGGFAKLQAIYRRTLARLDAMETGR